MITPGGVQCFYYYEDFARGANIQECRVRRDPRSVAWQPTDCRRCPVPGLLAANGSPHLELRMTIRPGVLGFGRHIDLDVWCALHGPIEGDPRVGCTSCNAEADELLARALD